MGAFLVLVMLQSALGMEKRKKEREYSANTKAGIKLREMVTLTVGKLEFENRKLRAEAEDAETVKAELEVLKKENAILRAEVTGVTIRQRPWSDKVKDRMLQMFDGLDRALLQDRADAAKDKTNCMQPDQLAEFGLMMQRLYTHQFGTGRWRRMIKKRFSQYSACGSPLAGGIKGALAVFGIKWTD